MSRLAARVQAVHEDLGISGQQHLHQVVLQLLESLRHSGALLQHVPQPGEHQGHLLVEMVFKLAMVLFLLTVLWRNSVPSIF